MSELRAGVDTVTDWTYSYDPLGRLSIGVSTNTGQGCQFTYDSFGNRMSEAPYQSGSCYADYLTFAASATNQADTFCYDAAGNLLSPGACASGGSKNAYLYDAYGTLLVGNYNQSPYTSYSVDEYERRVAKWQSGAIDHQYLYGADINPVAEADGAGNWLQTNVRAGGMLLAELQPSGITYLHTDHLGTIRAESNSSGTRTMTCSNLPFGDALNCNGNTGPSGYHFTGKERDSESGNDYFGARYYASSMGRFISPDPAGLSAVNPSFPQTWNLYAYAVNNPLLFTDPTGLDCVYYTDDGTGVESIDHNSNSDECAANGGNWEEGKTFADWQHYDSKTDTWNGASMDSQNVYFYQGSAPGGASTDLGPDATGSDYFLPACQGNCFYDSGSTSASSLMGQLQNGGTLYGLLSWAVSQGPSGPDNPNWVGGLQADFLNPNLKGGGGSVNNWCGAGGAGVPGNGNDWGCMAHDYGYLVTGNTWPGGNYNPFYKGGPQLQQVNRTLCANVSGVGGAEITAFFGATWWGCHP